MDFIFGGAYQGKTAYAREKYGFSQARIYTCTGGEIDFSYPCIRHLEEFCLHCIDEGKDAVACLDANRDKWEGAVFLCADLSCGVVPMDARDRAWRQEVGKVMQYLSRNAQSVTRIFCGLEQKLK